MDTDKRKWFIRKYAMAAHGASERRACRVVGLSRLVNRYEHKVPDDAELIDTLGEPAERQPQFGFRKLFMLLRKTGHPWSHKPRVENL